MSIKLQRDKTYGLWVIKKHDKELQELTEQNLRTIYTHIAKILKLDGRITSINKKNIMEEEVKDVVEEEVEEVDALDEVLEDEE